MNPPGDSDLLVVARRVLLDAIDALSGQRDALILIGAQAIYLQTGDAPVALPAATKDSDLAIDRRHLHPEPRLEQAMTSAGFLPGTDPGAWLSPDGVPVDLMIPESMSDPGGRRGGRVPPHSRRALRRASGLEAAIVDHAPITITALTPDDRRSRTINVAGPGALLVAKLHKLGERNDRNPARLNDKDAHDVYRLLVSIQTTALADAFARLLTDDISAAATRVALEHLDELFARGADARGSQMAGRAEGQLGAPEIVAQSVATLAADLSRTIAGRPLP